MKKRLVTTSVVIVLIAGLLGYAGYSIFISPKDSSPDSKNKKSSGSKGTVQNESKVSGDDSQAGNIVTASSTEYENDRYGFRTKQPVEWTRRLSQNGDGAVLTSPDGKAVIRSYGFQNTVMKSLSEVYADMEANRRSMFPDFSVVEKKEGLIDSHPDIEAVWQYTEQKVESPFTGQVKTKIMITLKDEAGLGMDYTALTGDYDAYIDVFSAMMAEYKLQ